jgi:hypothetical protein
MLAATMVGVKVASSEERRDGAIWKGDSDGFVINWREDEFTVTRNDAVVLDFGAIAQREWLQISRQPLTTFPEFNKSYSLLSIVGPWLSVLGPVDEPTADEWAHCSASDG